MKIEFIDDIHNFFKFWSTRLWGLAAAFMGVAVVYAFFAGLAPAMVAGIPQILLTILVMCAGGCALLAGIARAVKQPNLYDGVHLPGDPLQRDHTDSQDSDHRGPPDFNKPPCQ